MHMLTTLAYCGEGLHFSASYMQVHVAESCTSSSSEVFSGDVGVSRGYVPFLKGGYRVATTYGYSCYSDFDDMGILGNAILLRNSLVQPLCLTIP